MAIRASLLAGEKILEVYNSGDFEVAEKHDFTPVTKADKDAHHQIISTLAATCLPVLSEEGVHTSFQERKKWDMFWLVDPLDGTKEFIKRNDEFTVNIALVQNCRPVAGVIFAPVTRELYAAIQDIGAFKLLNPEEDCTFGTVQHSGTQLPGTTNTEEYVVATSRSHMNPGTEKYIAELKETRGQVRLVAIGSSLKLCRIAEGTVNIYPKIGTTMEWDTAAGHAILKASGKNIYLHDLKTELTYNKENLQNPDFVAF